MDRVVWIYLSTVSAVAFVLNWAWEMAQMPGYAEMAGRPWSETLWRCTMAAGGDVAVTLGVYGVGAMAAGCMRWGQRGSWNAYAAAAVMGAVAAAAIEWQALGAGKWSYNDRMPIVPLLDVGLWPLLQLSMLIPMAMLMARALVSMRASASH
ncbi:MAG: hypothetical protein WD847_18220 [Pirellulales bacterium]